jgi:hypothetical protein
MAVVNPPGYLHNASPAATGEGDRLAAITSRSDAPSGLADLKARSCVRSYPELAVTANGTPNMTVNVAAGFALIQGTQNAVQGAYVFMNDGSVSLSITTASAVNPRWDLIIARIYDSQYSGATNTSALEVVTGTAAASPTDPAVPANSLVLARVVVAANDTAIGAGDIVDLRPFATQGIYFARSQAERDAITKYPGLSVYRIDTQTLEIWNATSAAWNSETTSSGTSGIASAATGWTLVSQQWTKKKGMMHLNIEVDRTGASINSGSLGNIPNQVVATVAGGSRPVQEVPMTSGQTGRMVVGTCDTAGNIRINATTPSQDIATGENITLLGTWIL